MKYVLRQKIHNYFLGVFTTLLNTVLGRAQNTVVYKIKIICILAFEFWKKYVAYYFNKHYVDWEKQNQQS